MASQNATSGIEAAGDAFEMAQKWLRQKGLRPDMVAETSADGKLDQLRTPGMGLGAAYLPHYKGKAAVANVEKHLVRRISAVSHAGPNSTLKHHSPEPDVPSDEDDLGRGSTFALKPKTSQIRHEEYAIQPSVAVRKKKKKKPKKLKADQQS